MDWQYVSGFFDGEGGTHIRYNRCFKNGKLYKSPRLQITIVNTDKKPLEKIVNFLRSSGIVCGIYRHTRPSRQPSYSIRITSLEAMEQFVTHVEPFVIAKADVLRIVREALTLLKNRHPGQKNRARWDSNDLSRFDAIVCRHATFIKKGPHVLT